MHFDLSKLSVQESTALMSIKILFGGMS